MTRCYTNPRLPFTRLLIMAYLNSPPLCLKRLSTFRLFKKLHEKRLLVVSHCDSSSLINNSFHGRVVNVMLGFNK